MKKISASILFVLLFINGLSVGLAEPLANEDLDGLYAKSIEQVLRMSPDQIDLGTAALIISEKWSDLVHGREHQAQLDNMAMEIRVRLKEKKLKTNHKAIPVINQYLFEELGFKSIAEASNPDDLFLHTVLDKKRGYCLSLSVLYLSIGERLGLPLHGVVAPGHFFVRYDDGKVRFNIETTSKGAITNDKYYIETYKIENQDYDSIYMANLDKMQTLGCFFNNLGNSYDQTGNIDSAMQALQRSIQINPSLSEARLNLGNIYLKKGWIDDAIGQYRTAMRINPNDAKIHTNLGNAYAQKNWLNEASAQYTAAIKLDPKYTDAYRNLAIVYCKQQRFSSALSKLKHALSLEPKNVQLYSQLAETYRQMEDYEEAIRQYRNALRFNPNLAAVHFGLALCYNSQGFTDEVILEYRKALSLEPHMVAALVNLGGVYVRKQQYPEALDLYKKAARIEPANSSIHFNLGVVYANMERFEQAAEKFRKSVEIDPGYAEAHYQLAFAYYKLKEFDLAFEHIKTAQNLGAEISADLFKAIKRKVK